MQIKRVGIILKKGSEESRRIGGELADWFTQRTITTVFDAVPPDLDCLVILGGDGTLLHVADQASRYEIPVIGINLGGLGFLTEVGINEKYLALEAIITGPALIEDRMMIKTRLCNPEQNSEWLYALNDVIISKGNVDRLVQFSTWADDEYITTYKADGLIFSTPTGSTAYNLSAGGPIVHPALQSIVVTPICPFMLETRSVLLPSSSKLLTRLAGSVNDLKVIVDGRFAWNMEEHNALMVEVSDKPLRLICVPGKGYFEILRSKLNWGGSKNTK